MTYRMRSLLLCSVFAALVGAPHLGCGGDVVDDSASGGATSGGTGSGGGANNSGGSSASGGAGSASGGSVNVDDYNTCTHNSQCIVTANSCCGTCGAPSVDDMVGVRFDQQDEFYQDMCPVALPCPACAVMSNPNLFAYCDLALDGNGRCTAANLPEHQYSECTLDSDCVIAPDACCECGAGDQPWEIVAVAQGHLDDLRDSRCSGATTPICAGCLWQPPAEVSVSCQAGHCVLQDPRAP